MTTTRGITRATPALDEAAEVRRLAVQAFGKLDSGMSRPELYEAIFLCKHLRADTEQAMFAHGVLVRVVRDELAHIGVTDESFVALLNALYAFVYATGYEWRDRWCPTTSPWRNPYE